MKSLPAERLDDTSDQESSSHCKESGHSIAPAPELLIDLSSTGTAVSSTAISADAKVCPPSPQRKQKPKKRSKKMVIKEDYIDIIRDDFWNSKSWLLAS